MSNHTRDWIEASDAHASDRTSEALTEPYGPTTIDVTFTWAETVHYQSTITLREADLSAMEALHLDWRDPLHVDEYFRDREDVWFPHVDTDRDMVGVNDREITDVHEVRHTDDSVTTTYRTPTYGPPLNL